MRGTGINAPGFLLQTLAATAVWSCFAFSCVVFSYSASVAALQLFWFSLVCFWVQFCVFLSSLLFERAAPLRAGGALYALYLWYFNRALL